MNFLRKEQVPSSSVILLNLHLRYLLCIQATAIPLTTIYTNSIHAWQMLHVPMHATGESLFT